MQMATRFALACALCASVSVHAAVLNGDFGTGNLSDWTRTGNGSVENTLAGAPPSGNPFQAFVGTTSVPALYALGSGFAQPVATLNSALGLSATALDGLKRAGDVGDVGAGSAIAQSFTANAGDTVSFSFNFLTDESANANGNDFAFVLFDGTLTLLSNTFSPLQATSSVFTNETGYKDFTLSIGSSGTHSLAFGVVDVNDALGASALLIDNVAVHAVPEPSSVVLVMVGLLAVGALSGARARSTSRA